jgi:prepilin-type N-terminal cleavage/methylation domain-containing protein/prepilin-type processing-associated H-X9-DG protein
MIRRYKTAVNNRMVFSGIMRRVSRGFTLIELLVVISIIALLVGILLPALGAARESARGLVCQTHQKNLSTAFVAYGTDNQEWWPGWAKSGISDIRNRYTGSWIPSGGYLNTTGGPPAIKIEDGSLFQYTPDKGVFVCPSDPFTHRSSGLSYTISHHLYRKVFPSGARGSSVEPAYESFVGPSRNLQVMYPWAEKFRSPSNLIFLIDEGGQPESTSDGTPVRGVNDGYFMDFWSDLPGGNPGFVDRVKFYHSGQAAYGFADGHGELRQKADEEIYKYVRGYTVPGTSRRFEYGRIWDPAAMTPQIIGTP